MIFPNNKTIKKLIIVFLLCGSLITQVSAAEAPSVAVEETPKAPVESVKTPPKAPRTIDEIIYDSSIKYGVSEAVMRKVIYCESRFNPNAVGDNGNSYGLVQIFLRYHPQVTKAQALDPVFATEFLAAKLAKNQGYLWTCYRAL